MNNLLLDGCVYISLCRYSPRVTPSGEKMNLFNHSAFFNMSVSPAIIRDIVKKQNTKKGFFEQLLGLYNQAYFSKRSKKFYFVDLNRLK